MSYSSLENHLHRLCGGRYAQFSETLTIRISGMAATVERALYRCSKCGDEQRTVEQRESAERAAVESIRATHGLMAPKQIRQLREALGLTPAQLGELLYGTPKGIVEGWEKGRYVQNREADAMLRSFEDRETLELRAAKAGVVLPDPALLAGTPAAPPVASSTPASLAVSDAEQAVEVESAHDLHDEPLAAAHTHAEPTA
jgi:DNA-binding transcriptional regulator YiaG